MSEFRTGYETVTTHFMTYVNEHATESPDPEGASQGVCKEGTWSICARGQIIPVDSVRFQVLAGSEADEATPSPAIYGLGLMVGEQEVASAQTQGSPDDWIVEGFGHDEDPTQRVAQLLETLQQYEAAGLMAQ